ncbi:C-type lectin domain family 12 member B-like isoform X1 [Melanotaenia boesemani]|uniref:C-type lectin domain family 12 member B-like isoform X1 n=1 Tax=Melanotaenia boesemani TaxID=1250792 RepID=UPI001C05C10B|nr:C-type lectin domain family 12 member B-like isoform X1 [Melanotaenia boesemani]
MEEEVSYSTVVFKNGRQPPKEKNEDMTVYAEIKHSSKDTAAPPIQAEAAAASHTRLLLVCLGFLCFVLIGSIVAIIHLSVNLSDVSKTNKLLTQEKNKLENQTEEISRHKENLNWTLGVIMKFNNFPVNDFCPDKKCQPCRKGWIQYQEKCYLFYEDSPWKTWSDSRQYCKDKAADLVVIDNLQEQEFISTNIKFYFDIHHGYWMGLQKTDNKWVWIDGREDSLGYWGNSKDSNIYGLLIPGTNTTQSWNSKDNGFLNKFICEDDKVLIRSN